MVQRPIGNYISVIVLYNSLGINIPWFLSLGDSQYLFCVDIEIDFESICEKCNYRYYPAYKMNIDNDKYNNKYQIIHTYNDKENPYKLEKYIPSEYDYE